MADVTNPHGHLARLLLVRHGQTEWNRDGRYQGRSDTVLSPLGHEQAHALGTRLEDSGARALISSPLRRARDTAAPIARRLGLELAVDERLCELSYGEWEGLTQIEVKARWPEALRNWKRQPDAHPPAGGEPLPLAAERVRQCLNDIATALPAPVIVVTHAGVIRIARLLAEQAALGAFRQIAIGNSELCALDWPPRRP
ncbi:histidine phosphatase family protein [Acidihalobacter prosperus]|uniref:histidine phosphatase family protein n=1 Tax=Acidihalobacter prosperus TaxID=160660 RepID=UPI000505608A|nr:histidine phosphatase family protein [Acidihalobacter prosperus]